MLVNCLRFGMVILALARLWLRVRFLRNKVTQSDIQKPLQAKLVRYNKRSPWWLYLDSILVSIDDLLRANR